MIRHLDDAPPLRQSLEMDTREQLQVILAWLNTDDRLGYALEGALTCGTRNQRVAAAWVQYVAARNLLVIDGRRFSLESPLGEINDALKDAE